MRNLRNIHYNLWKDRSEISSVCWDPAKDEILCTVGPIEEGIELVRVSKRPHSYVLTPKMFNMNRIDHS
jgi:elongator complex protein 1